MTRSLITSDVSLDAQGKQAGFLRVPHSTDRSAYGWIGVPITVIAHGIGPTLVLSAAVHGDEYEGQIAVSELARELAPEDIRGRLILLPMMNPPAALAGRRVSPVDGGNLNRLYPGDPHGTPSQMIAHYHEEVILPRASHAVDLHAGGASLLYPATLLRGPSHSADEEAGLALLTEAFDLPVAWVFTSGGGRHSTARTAMGAANRKGVINVMAELGGGAAVQRDTLNWTRRGLRRVLAALGMLPGYTPDATRGTRALHVRGSIYAVAAGVFEPCKALLDPVHEGERIGYVHDPSTPGAAPVPMISPHDGVVLALRALGRTERGDALFQIAADV
ncbi:MAG: succinylglutamate desuccinylase/aspartoacylase family protein [Pseudomonadota bacterium]